MMTARGSRTYRWPAAVLTACASLLFGAGSGHAQTGSQDSTSIRVCYDSPSGLMYRIGVGALPRQCLEGDAGLRLAFPIESDSTTGPQGEPGPPGAPAASPHGAAS